MKKIRDLGYIFVKKVFSFTKEKRLFARKYYFVNRSKQSENLFIVLAGFQNYYWNGILKRVRKCQDKYLIDNPQSSIDICVCVPKGDGNLSVLEKICSDNGWSYLRINEDLLAKVQNTAIKLHPKAKWIYKIDEDIVLPNDYISSMKEAWLKAECSMPVTPAILAPCINVNAYGVIPFMRALKIENEYIDKFGRFAFGAPYGKLYHGDKIHADPDVGKWIWEKSIPFDEVATVVSRANKNKIGWCPNRFSIGAILLKREFWNLIGGFEVGTEGEMGLEEVQINAFCASKNCGIFVAEDIFVGHLGFGRQKEIVKKFYFANKRKIDCI